jgi:hypothetical protein
MAKWQWGEMAKGKMTKGKMGKGEMAKIGGEMVLFKGIVQLSIYQEYVVHPVQRSPLVWGSTGKVKLVYMVNFT